jgi:serine/threonine protein kinase
MFGSARSNVLQSSGQTAPEAQQGGSGLRSPEETDAPPLHVGQILDGKYELLRWLACGGMGEVWVARHRTLLEPVAIKVLFRSYGLYDGGASSTRFLLEARIAARLSTKTAHVVRVTDYGHHGTRPYLVMDLLDGETLESELQRGPLPPQRVAEIVSQIARALTLAHADGILHRDIKPANVFLAVDEHGALLVKLLDFGIARPPPDGRLAARPRVTGAGLPLGTPAYMSPEQVAASSEVDLQCDLWALAATAFEALSGQLPVHGRDVRELFLNLLGGRVSAVRHGYPGVPKALCPFFERAFARRTGDRYESATNMATAFQRAAKESVGTARTERMAGSVGRPVSSTVRMALPARPPTSRRAHRVLALFASIALLAAVGAVSSSWPATATTVALQSVPHRTVAPRPRHAANETLQVAPAPSAVIAPVTVAAPARSGTSPRLSQSTRLGLPPPSPRGVDRSAQF